MDYIIDNSDEWERCSDIGEDLANLYDDVYGYRSPAPFKNSNKYVITMVGISGNKIYLQDRKISKMGFWTMFKENALIFNTKNLAMERRNTLFYGNPQVEKIT